MTSQLREDLRAETTRNTRRCSRTETASARSCSLAETLVETSCSRPETASEVFRSHSETSSCTQELEFASKTLIVNANRRNKLPTAVFASNSSRQYLCTNLESGSTKSKWSSLTTTMWNLLFAEAEQKRARLEMSVHTSFLDQTGSSTDKLSLDLKFNTWDTAIAHRPEWHSKQHSLHTVRPIRIPGAQSSKTLGSMVSRCSILD